jgi:hypothetical protein
MTTKISQVAPRSIVNLYGIIIYVLERGYYVTSKRNRIYLKEGTDVVELGHFNPNF